MENRRNLENIIDTNKYVVSKGIRKCYTEKLFLRENGEIQLNSTFLKNTLERKFAIAFSKDFIEVIVVPNCEQEIQFSKNGIAKDVDLIKKFGKKNKPFPFIYDLSWDEKKELWKGELNTTTKE